MRTTLLNGAFVVRPAAEADTDAILEVYRQCEDFLALGPVAKASREMVLADIAASRKYGGIFCGILGNDGRMAGIVDYIPSGFEGDPGTAFLELLMIALPFRKLGLGRAVVEAVESEIRMDPRVTVIKSGVQVNNPEAIRFWRRNGYRIVSGPRHHPDLTTAYDLIKELA